MSGWANDAAARKISALCAHSSHSPVMIDGMMTSAIARAMTMGVNSFDMPAKRFSRRETLLGALSTACEARTRVELL